MKPITLFFAALIGLAAANCALAADAQKTVWNKPE
jgi:hypothetical protein